MKALLLPFTLLCLLPLAVDAQQETSYKPEKQIVLTSDAYNVLKGKKILYIERKQYAPDHHNTATLFQKGEINENSFTPGSAMRVYDVDSRTTRTIIELLEGVVRDPELSFDGKKILFSMRKSKDEYYHLYEIEADGSGLKQLTHTEGVSDIDPIYLPDGGIVFSSTREPKYCMCNRHIMANLYRMNSDGTGITQIGKSTLFEGHSSLLPDGRILYDRWEYVDRNFGDAQALWVVNPDGTKHAIYYGNNTSSPGGVIDARPIPGTNLIVCIFGSCHDRPWGAMAIIDRRKGVDGQPPVVQIWPKEAMSLVGNGNLDTFKGIANYYEDPYPVSQTHFLVSRTIWKKGGWNPADSKQGIYLAGMDGLEEIILEGTESLFDPMILEARPKPQTIPSQLNETNKKGLFYVQNVYEGTHMQGVKKGDVKYLRVIESPEKRTWAHRGWFGEGEQAPGMNWHGFENKSILGEVPVEEDGSASFEVPPLTFVYFQLLDKDKKMIQSMRSGITVMPGETNGCIGCHEDRLSAPIPGRNTPTALKKAPRKLTPWMNKEPVKFSFMEQVQPILDKRCVQCHDFDPDNRAKTVLARDKNPYFNAAYINLYVKKSVKLIGGGPAAFQLPYTWGSHASKLTELIDGNHRGVKLTQKEKEILYTWMDLNGIYYPVYETSFEDNLAGRCPLNDEEMAELSQLTGISFNQELNSFQRTQQAQISFDRPAQSPCLDAIKNEKQKYDRALQLLRTGQKRLKETPRGDIEKDLVVGERMQRMLQKYCDRLSAE